MPITRSLPDHGPIDSHPARAGVLRWLRARHDAIAGRRGESGQLLVIMVIALVAIIAVAGLLVDGGMAWTTRRMAQNGADVSALAAAKKWSTTADKAQATTAAQSIAGSNGFTANYTDCDGRSRNDGVTVNIPPLSGAFSGIAGLIEVIVQRPMKTSFSAIVGQNCWMVSARAVAVASSNDVASCTFCSLNNSSSNHTLVLKNGAILRVDGDIYVNSTNGGYTPGTCSTSGYKVCGDGFDVFGDGGTISARTISVVGGWETHNQNIASADNITPGCEHPVPPSSPTSINVCIHMPSLTDPLNNPSKPGSAITPPPAGAAPVAGSNGCPATATVPAGTVASPSLLTITSGTRTICPGTYFGGLKVTGGTVTMSPGIYVLVGGGFTVTGGANIDGSGGVLIYSEGGGSASQSTTTANDLVPDPIPGHVNFKNVVLAASPGTTVNPNTPVTFTFTLTPNGSGAAVPGGTVDFYDGNVQICSAAPVTRVAVGKNPGKATCTASFAIYGTRAISAVFTGDATYNPVGDTLTETVKTPGGVTTGPITIDTTGKVDLAGPSSGPYSGLTLFQERNSNLTVTLSPGKSSQAKCAGNFMSKGVPPDNSAPPDACGNIGGLQGTVYAPNQDALVLIEASGMANLQVIAGKIEVDSGANARFGFDASKFANSSVHLVE